MPLALIFWVLGFLFALWAAVPTLALLGRPARSRPAGWASLPLLSVSLFLSVALIVPLLLR